MQGAIIGGIMAFLVLILTAVGIILYIRYKKRYIRKVHNILPFIVLQKLYKVYMLTYLIGNFLSTVKYTCALFNH